MTFSDRIVVIFLLLWSSSQACNTNESCFIDMDNPNIKNLVASMDYFTTQVIQKMIRPQRPFIGPAVVSPMSIYTMLVLVLFGSGGNTQTELIKALKFPDTDLQDLKVSFGDILIATNLKYSEIINENEDVTSDGHVAEGFFIQKQYTLVEEYADYLNALNIKTHPVDFLNMQEAMKVINQWIAENKPPSDSSASSYSSSGNTRLHLTSLFYLTARWQGNLFLDRAPGPVPFHTIDNRVVDVQMMKTSALLFHYDNQSTYSAVEIPCEWGDFKALFILPHKGVDPFTFVTTFTMDVVKEFLSEAEEKDIDCQIPTFSFTYSLGLNNQLQGLGVKELFGVADLSAMLEVPKQNLGVQTSHSVEITVNEKGISADRLNVVPVQKDPPPPTLIPFVADHPFLMLVRCTNSHAIVFASFIYTSTNTISASTVP